ncbi:hypothetical protein QE197_10340 [Arsenophonus nasoniae]|nr:hypothetical protein [Arsenophonus nasoniae]WGM09299.1 hypothetical protein QE197_10340 [Arsenophonus nasoniae]WGM14022.1 hypothetical protein QE193_10230 [Arsenophonus nasoniae]
MYIPRPAKLLFQYDDGWNLFIENNYVDEWCHRSCKTDPLTII